MYAETLTAVSPKNFHGFDRVFSHFETFRLPPVQEWTQAESMLEKKERKLFYFCFEQKTTSRHIFKYLFGIYST